MIINDRCRIDRIIRSSVSIPRLETYSTLVRGEPEMKRGRKLTSSERQHISKSIARVEDWLISKKETYEWLLIHKATGQAKNILAP